MAGGPRGFAAAPHRIVLNLTPSPATSVAITWRSDLPPATALVQVSAATAEPLLGDKARSVAARVAPVVVDRGATVYHCSAVVDGLAPGTLYGYRVGDGATWSEWNQFRTAQLGPAPLRFLFFGDPQNDLKEHCTRTFRTAFARAGDSAFYLLAGDLVTATTDDRAWGELFDAVDPLWRVMPGLIVPGNHEYGQFGAGGEKRKVVSPLFRAHFTLPENGPAGLEETSGCVDYQGVRIVCLNGNERLPEQAAWLDQLLAARRGDWTIVLVHQPAYSTGKSRDATKIREMFGPVFDRHAVDLVLQGHDHTYARTFKLRGDRRVADTEPGTVYVVSVAGPKHYPVNPAHGGLMARISSGSQLFQIIDVDGPMLRFEAWTVTGERHDAFVLRKHR